MSTATSACFFCQNLLSDFIEGILPESRKSELESHMASCKECSAVHRDLRSTLDLLHALPSRPLSHEMALQITQASHPRRPKVMTRARVSRAVLFLAVPVLLFAGTVVLFPKLFPWFTRLRPSSQKDHFVRYFPLLQGASEIIEEQASWLHVRGPFMRSFWEEGGLSPEEFEKTFSGKGPLKPEETSREEPDVFEEEDGVE
jgi:hypothetical protein